LSDFAGKRLDTFVTGWGTGGTLTGAGQMLKLARPDLKIVVCEPAEAQLLDGQPFRPHKIQGWVPDFVPTVLDRTIFDQRLAITDDEAITTARALAHQEGLFVGISAGATFAGAMHVANTAPAGSVVLAMLPDTGERYLSTALFENLNQGSDPV
jgi:cysteine synthase A